MTETAPDPDVRAAQLATLATSLITVPLDLHRTGADLRPGDLVMEVSSFGPADPDGIGWLLRIEGQRGDVADRYVIEPLGRSGVEQGWSNAQFFAVPDRVVDAVKRVSARERRALAEIDRLREEASRG